MSVSLIFKEQNYTEKTKLNYICVLCVLCLNILITAFFPWCFIRVQFSQHKYWLFCCCAARSCWESRLFSTWGKGLEGDKQWGAQGTLVREGDCGWDEEEAPGSGKQRGHPSNNCWGALSFPQWLAKCSDSFPGASYREWYGEREGK